MGGAPDNGQLGREGGEGRGQVEKQVPSEPKGTLIVMQNIPVYH